MKENIREHLAADYPDSIILDGLDNAIIGVTDNDNVVYSEDKIIDVFMERDHMTYEEASEFYEYNVVRTIPYISEGPAPIIVKPL